MKPVLLLLVLLSAALAAPAEDKPLPAETDEAQAAAAEEEGGADLADPRYNLCPPSWSMYDGRCYVHSSTPKSWHDAEEHCNSLGGHLASVVSARHYNFLQQMIRNAGQSSAWLGGFYLQNRWLWINRDGFYYNNWYQILSVPSNPCIFMLSEHGCRNTQCTSTLSFICTKSPFGC